MGKARKGTSKVLNLGEVMQAGVLRKQEPALKVERYRKKYGINESMKVGYSQVAQQMISDYKQKKFDGKNIVFNADILRILKFQMSKK